MSPPRPEPSTAILVICGPVAAGDAERLCDRLRALVAASDAEVVVCDVRALAADARSVDALARLQLTARRLGRRIRLHRASRELDALLSFLGLAEAVGGARRADSVRARGQAEQRKQPLGVEEGVERDDAPA